MGAGLNVALVAVRWGMRWVLETYDLLVRLHYLIVDIYWHGAFAPFH